VICKDVKRKGGRDAGTDGGRQGRKEEGRICKLHLLRCRRKDIAAKCFCI